MWTPPPDLTGAEIRAVVADFWSITATWIDYALVGFGSHHWLFTEPNGRWFVTADAVADVPQRLAELAAALSAAHALRHRWGLEFVVAPRQGIDIGLVSIAGRYALALYPYRARTTEAPADSQQILSMIIAVHAATAELADRATIDDFIIPDRPALEAVLARAAANESGPFAADFAALIREPFWSKTSSPSPNTHRREATRGPSGRGPMNEVGRSSRRYPRARTLCGSRTRAGEKSAGRGRTRAGHRSFGGALDAPPSYSPRVSMRFVLLRTSNTAGRCSAGLRPGRLRRLTRPQSP